MDASQASLQVPGHNVGATHSRQVRLRDIYTATRLQHEIYGPKWYGSRRFGTEELVLRKQLCEPSYKAFGQGTTSHSRPESTRYSHCSMVARTNMVRDFKKIGDLSTSQDFPQSDSTTEPRYTRTAKKQEMEAVCLETLWESRALQQGWSLHAASRLMFGWSQSTIENYNVHIAKVKKVCESLCKPFPPANTAILAECLLCITSKSDRPQSMVNCTLAALSHVYMALGENDYTKDVAIKQLTIGIIKSSTKCHRLKSNVMPVEYFTNYFGNLNNLTIEIKILRMKCICLLAIVTMLRPSDIAPKAVL